MLLVLLCGSSAGYHNEDSLSPINPQTLYKLPFLYHGMHTVTHFSHCAVLVLFISCRIPKGYNKR